ncbi:hypothetical protein [Mesorhizobium sp.]|uniref:hypothetical protein n=1 Tax=Mesorhizobium sp. TaxID=1871066 RepID=UPI00257A2601|nr:hypothetical protein [Mesorhizobium sp.]
MMSRRTASASTAAAGAASRLLDVRDAEAFQADHAASAVRVPVELWEAAAKTGETSFENTSYWERAITPTIKASTS